MSLAKNERPKLAKQYITTLHYCDVPANKQKYVPLSGNKATFNVRLSVVHAIGAACDVTILSQG